jgi:hypothetical protein
MSLTIRKETNDFIQEISRIMQKNLDMDKTLSFNFLKTNLAILKYGNPQDSGFNEGLIGQSKEFYEAYKEHVKDTTKPEYSESELYLMDMNKRLKDGERVKANDSENISKDQSFKQDQQVNEDKPNFEAGGFKSFEIEKIEDSNFSGQFNPIFERENEGSSQNEGNKEEGSKKETKNIFTRTGSLFKQQDLKSKGKLGGSNVNDGKVKISFKNDNINENENRQVQVETEGEVKVVGMGEEGDVKVLGLKGKGEDIHLTIKEEVIINETIVTVEEGESQVEGGNDTIITSMEQGNGK